MKDLRICPCVVAGILLLPPVAFATCRDNVVMVHGNGSYPSDFDNTYNELLARG